MIVSMTGFGSATLEQEGLSCAVEIRSVNNRFFKAVIKLPDELLPLEPEIEKLLRDAIGRGSIVLAITLRDKRLGGAVRINQEVLNAYAESLQAVYAKFTAGKVPVPATVELSNLLSLPGVLDDSEITDYLTTHRDALLALVRDAVARHAAMRQREGESLWQDLQKHLEVIRKSLANIAAQAPNVPKAYNEKLKARVQQLVSENKLSLNDDELLKEVALFADRADISEEIQRLGGHVEQFTHVCEKEAQAGRKLDFISQELLREANTIASKANDVQIARWTVDIKSAIDRIKEQVQNVE